MLKKYHQRNEHGIENHNESDNISEPEVSQNDGRMEQVAAIACVIDDGIHENSEFEIEDDKWLLPLCSVKQRETLDDVMTNPELSLEQQTKRSQKITEHLCA